MIFATSLPIFIPIIACVLLAAFTVFCIVNKKFRKAKTFRRIGIVALLLLAIMRPAIGASEIDRELTNLNIYFVIDNSGSMATRDMESGTIFRYEKIAEDMKNIVKLFPGSKYSIIALDYNVYQAMPLISSAETTISYINGLSPKNNSLSSDSNLSDLLSFAGERIEKYSKRFPDRSNILFFMSDGEDASVTTKVNSSLGSLLNGGAVIGYGATTPSPVYEIDYKNNITNTELKNPNTRKTVTSSLNEKNMQNIASALSLPYYRRSSSSGIFAKKENFVNTEITRLKGDRPVKVDNELYWIPSILAVALLIYDLLKILDELLLERKAAK